MSGPPKPFQCKVCNGAYATQSALNSHECHTRMAKLVKNANTGMYLCKDCGFETVSQLNFRTHMVTMHLIGKKYCCQKCDYKGQSASELSDHIQNLHESADDTYLLCTHCGDKLLNKISLMEHLKTIHGIGKVVKILPKSFGGIKLDCKGKKK
jgi:predicted RNA-binding Zn-ribbon protein involved in translation (DUF1610 family)